ncbi:MAG: hypothetical protein HOV81_37235 [Kofleriaceae bacterium]|nr:hypothetical protein [Kofleriaceae bacterium]
MPDAAALPTELPERLSETGLYADIATYAVAPDFVAFSPANVLWSDGAVKNRWYRLPPGSVIDSSDMNHWRFPVGTMLFKEFAREGKRLETRLIWRVDDTGNRERDMLMGAYLWNDSETDAVFVKAGAEDVRGTDHDVPAADTCWRCHIGEPGQILGLSALQLGDVSALPLSVPPEGAPFAAPNAALGYLHANCGHCHNPNGSAWSRSNLVLRLDVEERDAATTMIEQSTVGVPLQNWLDHGYTYRVVAGDPDQSAIVARMSQRDVNIQMPPLATEHVDETGIALVRAWIQSL